MHNSPYYRLDTKLEIAIIELTLAHDLDIEAFNEITHSLIDRWPIDAGRSVVVDLTPSSYIGSVLMGLIINIRQRVRAGKGELIVAGASAPLARAFKTANLDRLIELASTREQALSRL